MLGAVVLGLGGLGVAAAFSGGEVVEPEPSPVARAAARAAPIVAQKPKPGVTPPTERQPAASAEPKADAREATADAEEQVANATEQPPSLQDKFKAALEEKEGLAEGEAKTETASEDTDESEETSKDTQKAHVMRVTLTVNPPDAKVYRNGAMEETTPRTYAVYKGHPLVVRVARPGYRSRTVYLNGSTHQVSITLEKINKHDPLTGGGIL